MLNSRDATPATRKKRCLLAALASLLLYPVTGMTELSPPAYPEKTVCGPVRESFAFWSWSRLAGRADEARAEAEPNAVSIEHRTRDGRQLMGYQLASTAPGGAVRGEVLVAQGNAMLADQLLRSLQPLARAGLEVYVFDYRGYGRSQGRARLQAIVGDYIEIHQRVVAESGRAPHLYGISFGGIVLLNLIGSGAGYGRVVIDSSPARVSPFGCPGRFDPARHMPASAANLMMIAGEQDQVVPLRLSGELVELARARGGEAVVREDFNHPYMDGDRAVHRARMALIRDFLVEED